jgi:CRP-like cAMP-binding protein
MQPGVAQKIQDFFSRFPIRHYRKGQILIHAGDDPTHVFHLVSGRVKQYDISYRGDEVVLNMFKPPAFFPMSYAINGTPNVYFFEADEDIELRPVPIDDVLTLLKANPDVTYDLLSRLYRGTDGLLGRIAHLMAGSARSRVLYELLIQARRFGQPVDDGTQIPANEIDIGAQAGLARETVNREINKLKRDGFIDVQNNQIVIKDLDQLAASVTREL